MSISIKLQVPDNASNPVSLAQTIRENNEIIVDAFAKAISRFDNIDNHLFVDLDLNGNKLLNVGPSPFITEDDLALLQVGNIRSNPDTGDLEYRRSNTTEYVVLYNFEELRGAPGNGIGDLLSNNNLSEVTEPSEARRNLGLEIGVDVLAHNPALDGFNPADKAAVDDPRFEGYPSILFSSDSTVTDWGRLYVYTSDSPSTLTVPAGTLGGVTSIYVRANSGSSLTLAPDTGNVLFRAGSTVSQNSFTINPGGFCTITTFASDGNQHLITGVGIF